MPKIHLTFPDGVVKNLAVAAVDAQRVYYAVVDFLLRQRDGGILSDEGHLIAADAEGWAELAAPGEHYEDSHLQGFSMDVEN